MNKYIIYAIIAALLLAAELIYFRIADKCNIIDKPSERSSHKKVVLSGGGIIFLFGFWIWSFFYGFHYPWALAGVTLAAGISFIDDIHSLSNRTRLITQFIAMGLLSVQLNILHINMWWGVLLALIVCVGASNIYNFMDGINGITGAYSLAVLIPLIVANHKYGFIENSFLWVITLSVLIFCFFNFRTKAKCFAGDVGSIGIAFILLFAIGKLIIITNDITWLVFLIVYGVDGCLTIAHRIMLRENLGEAHRKHAFQIMANELKIPQVIVSSFYAILQIFISLLMVVVIPNTTEGHWIFLLGVLIFLSLAYIIFIRHFYYLHEQYLSSIKKNHEHSTDKR